MRLTPAGPGRRLLATATHPDSHPAKALSDRGTGDARPTPGPIPAPALAATLRLASAVCLLLTPAPPAFAQTPPHPTPHGLVQRAPAFAAAPPGPLAPGVAPAPAGGQTLLQALALAYRTNPQLLAARAQLRGVDEGVTQAAAAWRPHVTVDAQAGFNTLDNSTDTLHRPENRTPEQFELEVDQYVFTSGRIASEVEQSKARVLAQRGSLLAAESTVLLLAGTAYLDVARDRRIVELERGEDAILARTLRASTIELNAGAVTPADLAQAQARLSDQQAATASVLATLQTSEASYEQQVGTAPGPVAMPAGDFPAPATREAAISRAMADNPDVLSSRGTLVATRLGVDIARDSLLPQVSLHALLQRRRQYEYDLYTQSTNAAQGLLQITVPLYQGGAEYSRIRQAKEQTIDAENLVQQAGRAARQQAIAAWATLEAARERLNRYELSERANRIALDGIARQQRVGARTVIDVLNAEQAVLASAVSAVIARHDVLTATLRLRDVTGSLDARDLGLDTPAYDPDRHYTEVHDKWIGTAPPPEPDATGQDPMRFVPDPDTFVKRLPR